MANGKPAVVLVWNTALLGLWGAPRGFRFDGTRQTSLPVASRWWQPPGRTYSRHVVCCPSPVLRSPYCTYALLFPRATDAVALLSLPVRGGPAGGRRQQTRLTRQPPRDEETQRHEGTDLDGPSFESCCRPREQTLTPANACKRPTVSSLIHSF